jgi:phosphatidylglycerophosphate synthase
MSVADKHNLLPIYVNDSDWMDIDTEEDLKKAEDFLIENLKNKETDGPVSKYINRRLSVPISKKLINYNITPNQISIGVFLTAVLGSFIIAQNNYFALLFGALLAQLSSVLDGCDGEIARLKLLKSKFGGWFDQVLDRYSDIFILSGLTIHCFNIYETTWVIIIGLLAVGTKTLLSYTAYKYDKIFKNNSSFRIGRDVTTLILFVGAILNFPYFTLILLTVLFNFEIFKRIYLLKDRLI